MSEAPPNSLSWDVAERRARFLVPESVYALDVIQGAAYLFIDRCYVWLDRPADAVVEVVLRTREAADADALQALAGEFANELLNQALRKNINASTGKLRELIMARAFFAAEGPSSIDRLLAELDEEEMASESLEIAVPWEKRNG